MQSYRRFYIDGEWSESGGDRDFDVVNPFTEKAFARIRLGNVSDVNRAVTAARTAFSTFQHTSKSDRIELLSSIIKTISEKKSELFETVTQELGTPIGSNTHVEAGIAQFEQAIETLENYEFERRIGSNIVRREPIGVCGIITAWNWPVQLICTKMAVALAAGCTVVVKPSEFTSITALKLAEALHDAGIPKGVFNLVLGDGPTVGAAMSAHEGIDMVAFTGSTRAGSLIAEAAAPSVKRVCQELGGKSPNIVLSDADLHAAVEWNVARAFSNTGQSCHAPSRMLVGEDMLEESLELALKEIAKIRVGDPTQRDTTMGPVVNRAQFDRIQRYIKSGIDDGARLVCGGLGRPDALETGFFIKPTVFANVTREMTIAKEEIFGPVLAVMTYKTEDEALEIANATPYGLGGFVFTSDYDKGLEIGRKIRAGRVFLNGHPSNTAAPMGGYGKSGNGREMGVFGLEEYLEVKALIGF